MKKALFPVLRVIISLLVSAFAALQLLGIWPEALKLAMPLLAVLLMLQGIGHWKSHRFAAVCSFGAALFITAVTLTVLFVR